jgi:hypothetical protein
MEEQALFFMGCCLFLPMLIPLFVGSPEPEIRTVTKVKFIKRPQTKFAKPNYKVKKVKAPEIIAEKEVPKILKEDAVECLTSLGLKKAAANKKVNDLFSKNKYNSLEEFLLDAYKL